ncbi:MAG TPA: YHS domain-containing (seleno)protein [Xanthobacteraceae bacterium]|jgi:hypothetical protein|nr:YHS domain-containing (seleno)protein [Xanthobacteraceae bacterium]
MVLSLTVPHASLDAGVSELVVADLYTGLAISGYDPVAFYVSGAPVQGRPAHELRFEQSVFRFRNEGNRAAFEANPEIYMPQFGGYDPIALARGVALAGNPLEWLIVGNRLYLFYSARDRAAFAASPLDAIAAAGEKWPEVVRSLIR